MKTGMEIGEVMDRLLKIEDSHKDYLVRSEGVDYVAADGDVRVKVNGTGTFRLTDNAHRQIAQRVRIPAPYYERMRNDHPALLAENVNGWHHTEPQKYFLRTVNEGYGADEMATGYCRAALSTSYRPIDNLPMLLGDPAEHEDPIQRKATSLLATIKEAGAEIQSCHLDDDKLYLKAVSPHVRTLNPDYDHEIDPNRPHRGGGAWLKKADPIQAGIVVRNSETGNSTFRVDLFVVRLVCTNGLIREEGLEAIKRVHLGIKQDIAEDTIAEVYRHETQVRRNEVLMRQCVDAARVVLDPRNLDYVLNLFRQAKDQPLEGDPSKLVEEIGKLNRFTEGQVEQVKRHLYSARALTRFGLVNAVTRTATDVEDYETATEFERIGGRLLDAALPQFAMAVAM